MQLGVLDRDRQLARQPRNQRRIVLGGATAARRIDGEQSDDVVAHE